MNMMEESPVAELQAQAAVSANSSDYELAKTYAPQLRLSGPGAVGVNLLDQSYPYTDYLPINANDVTSNVNRKIKMHLTNTVTYNGKQYGPGNVLLNYGQIDIIGAFGASADYLDFSPIWGNSSLLAGNSPVENGYKTLTLRPTVYFRVFKDYAQKNPIAIQYWFFYFYNDWSNDHPGDWETVTVFLNNAAQATEAAYSTHFEANRRTWSNLILSNITHPNVYISNGGHGSYPFSGNTSYTGVNDNHVGDRQRLNFNEGCCTSGTGCSNFIYCMSDLSTLEANSSNWIWFAGGWGNSNSAPKGPLLRTDAATSIYWRLANNPPYNPITCAERYNTRIYGNDRKGPWNWIAGYGLNTPWTSSTDCKKIPSIPSNVQATDGLYGNKVRITWNTVSGADSYQVFRCSSSSTTSCNNLKNKFITLSSTYDDTGVNSGSIYYYRVNACNNTGCSALSSYNTGYRSFNPVIVSPTSGSWTSSPQYLNISSSGATIIYFTMVNTYDGSTPANPASPSPSSNNGSLSGSSSQFQYYGSSGKLKKTKLRFVGCNSTGCGPVSSVYSYQIDLRGNSTITPLTVNGSAASGSISPAGDADWYKFTISTAGLYTIETLAGTLSDNYIYLYGPNSQTTLIEEDDDDGIGRAAKIVRSLSSGTYYVKVRAYYSSTGTGSYTIKVKNTPVSSLTVNAAAISGSIFPAEDEDWYRFVVPSTRTCTIETWAGTLSDNYMYLYGPNQTVFVESDDDDGIGNAAKIVRSLSAGTYYVKIRAYSSTGTGSYTIKVTY